MMTRQEWADAVEDGMYDGQVDFIQERFGTEASDNANYGWGVDVDLEKGVVVINTKVYGHGVVTTICEFPRMDWSHEFEPF